MDHTKEIVMVENQETDELSWKKYAIKQGYLIKFPQNLLNEPKMEYFVLTENGLISFECEPNHSTEPICFIPYEQLSSIKLDNIELNSIKLCCMHLTSKISPSFTLAFNRKQDRDEWIKIMTNALSEALSSETLFLEARVYSRPSSATDDDVASTSTTKEQLERKVSAITKEKVERKISTESYGQSLRRKRRKGNQGSIRRSKSFDSLAFHGITNAAFSLVPSANLLKPVTEGASLADSRKRKSESDIRDTSKSTGASTTDNNDNFLTNTCNFQHKESLNADAPQQIKNKRNTKHKTSMFAKLRSKLEHPSTVLFAH